MPSLTRCIGQTERTLQALLQRRLDKAAVTFPEWTILVFLSTGTLSRPVLLDRLTSGGVMDEAAPRTAIAAMMRKGWIFSDRDELSLSGAGVARFTPLRDAVDAITAELFADLPVVDVVATRRTLETVTERAKRLLAAEPAQANLEAAQQPKI